LPIDTQDPAQQSSLPLAHVEQLWPQCDSSLPTQAPPQQSCPAPHATPQPPQLLSSDAVSTHAPVQHALPIAAQSSMQLPQLAASAQVPPQHTSVVPQVAPPSAAQAPQ
jgi:hypothetical protein